MPFLALLAGVRNAYCCKRCALVLVAMFDRSMSALYF